MCRQHNHCGCSRNRAARLAQEENGCCSRCCDCDCGCGCDRDEDTAPTATISMADYDSFILVPTTVFDQGDVDCGCSRDW